MLIPRNSKWDVKKSLAFLSRDVGASGYVLLPLFALKMCKQNVAVKLLQWYVQSCWSITMKVCTYVNLNVQTGFLCCRIFWNVSCIVCLLCEECVLTISRYSF